MNNKKEVFKEDLSTYRTILAILITSFFGIIGYAIVNINKLDYQQVILGAFATLMLFLISYFVVKSYVKARKNLGDSE